MGIAREHAEQHSLPAVSGPYLPLSVLARAFSKGRDAHDPEVCRRLRLACGE